MNVICRVGTPTHDILQEIVIGKIKFSKLDIWGGENVSIKALYERYIVCRFVGKEGNHCLK